MQNSETDVPQGSAHSFSGYHIDLLHAIAGAIGFQYDLYSVQINESTGPVEEQVAAVMSQLVCLVVLNESWFLN